MSISSEQRARIVFLSGQGMTAREIARDVGCSHSTVVRWLQRFNSTGSLETLPRSGRPRATTALQDTAICDAARAHPELMAPALRSSSGFPVCLRTAINRLHEAELCVRTARERVMRTESWVRALMARPSREFGESRTLRTERT